MKKRNKKTAILSQNGKEAREMTSEEQRVYKLEKELIEKYFRGLRARAVRLIEDADFLGKADDPYLLINRQLSESPQALENILKHELIHYELKDKGRDYHGHGQAFLKRAAELGIVGQYELIKCFSSEEWVATPTKRRLVEIPLKKVREDIEGTIDQLGELVLKLPDQGKVKVKFYKLIHELRSIWMVYSQAVRNGQDCIIEERIERKRGPKGKSLTHLIQEYDRLTAEEKTLEEKYGTFPDNPKMFEKLTAVRSKRDEIWEKVGKDYGIDLA